MNEKAIFTKDQHRYQSKQWTQVNETSSRKLHSMFTKNFTDFSSWRLRLTTIQFFFNEMSVGVPTPYRQCGGVPCLKQCDMHYVFHLTWRNWVEPWHIEDETCGIFLKQRQQPLLNRGLIWIALVLTSSNYCWKLWVKLIELMPWVITENFSMVGLLVLYFGGKDFTMPLLHA